MKYLTARCEDHGVLLLDAEFVEPRENHVIECEGHTITRDTRDMVLLETTEYLPKTRCLTDAEFMSLPVKTSTAGELAEALDRLSKGKISRLLEPTL
jgi:hypothetical protein